MTWPPIPRHYEPYPEIAEPDAHDTPYEIIDTRDKVLPSSGMVDKAGRRLLVPLAATGRSVIRHEMAHVRWSPPNLPEVDFDVRVLLAVEDARINLGLERIGLPVRLGAGHLGNVASLSAADLERRDAGMLVLRAIAAIGTNAMESVLAPADDALPEARALAERLVERVRGPLLREAGAAGGPVAPFETALSVAAAVARELRAHSLIDDASAARHAILLCGGCCLADAERARAGDPAAAARATAGAGEEGPDGCGAEATVMKLAEVPLDFVCPPARGRAIEWRPAVEGSVIRHPGRWLIDRAIFRRAVRRRGGSVLVDTSSSMSLGPPGVERILRGAPGATLVAMYSGSGKEGELRVVAREGRRASAEHLKPYGSSNVIDDRALEWLAGQPAPRVWVSDGRVTGAGDKSSERIRRRCERICRRGAIRRVRTAEAAAMVLEGRARGPVVPPIPRGPDRG